MCVLVFVKIEVLYFFCFLTNSSLNVRIRRSLSDSVRFHGSLVSEHFLFSGLNKTIALISQKADFYSFLFTDTGDGVKGHTVAVSTYTV